ncbi:MAG: LLM class flavin-dependent oxidoreductase [Rhodobacteraceae bacterium]|nr:LLM class flavin-dependent oxidoreductase [Paracoccaceae bacterium]
MPVVSTVLIGNATLLVQCGEALLERGGQIARVVTRNDEIAAWAGKKNIAVEAPGKDLAERLMGVTYDWLFSIANLDIIAGDVLASAGRGAINFHDGPLPRFAGLNAPVWALLAGEKEYGITWHMISAGVDEGDIIAQENFSISADDTALTMNTKCYEAGVRGFERVLDGILADKLPLVSQDLNKRSYFARDKRPAAAGRLDFGATATELAGRVRALDHGAYWNPLSTPKFEAGGVVYLVTHAVVETGHDASAPGTVLDIRADQLLVATGDGALLLQGLKQADGSIVEVVDFAHVGDVLPSPTPSDAEELDTLSAMLAPGDGYWRRKLAGLRPAGLALATKTPGDSVEVRKLKHKGGADLAALAGFAARLAETTRTDIAFSDKAITDLARPGYCADWVPLRFDAGASSFTDAASDFAKSLEKAGKMRGFAPDLAARAPEIGVLRLPDIGISDGVSGLIKGTAVTFCATGKSVEIHADSRRVSSDYLDLLEARLELFLSEVASDAARMLVDIPFMPEAERDLILKTWNDTDKGVDSPELIHKAFEAQVAAKPDATAIIFEDQSLSYDALNRAANRAAHVLMEMGVAPGAPVALHLSRGPDMMIGALAIMKAGGAYVPLDPGFPKARLAHYLKDSGATVIVTEAALKGALPDTGATILELDDARIESAPETNPDSPVTSADLAYLIYTSGSTGTPKGVMVEHRNVANFFTGMDARIDHDQPGTWLAVTSLSFDISVLELFYTLARGFKLVLSGDEERALVSGEVQTTHSDRRMDFSLYFWGNDDGPGPKKYEMLLDGAKFADENGFTAVWTPERHFAAFGGPYPNPAVTGAAVAAVTKNLAVRSGSCVAPLHHPARVAEEWAIIDNLTDGRAGLGIAAGWQPHDFVLRPENSPPNNKKAMFDDIETIRKLWRGEEVEFPLADGTPHAVLTQPRPVSKELPVWVTIAGNPDTWREAGEIGANVLTHLLGQSIDEVEGKIRIYHDALRKAGHDPADFSITLMLHTYLAETREEAREMACGPMKTYMGAAAALIKQFAWVFPAFKRPKGVSNSFELDLDALTPDDVDAILEYAFNRYFEDSGLFGTVEDALARTEQLKRIGVDEIACLVDYGIEPEKVLEGLRPLAKVVAAANQEVVLADDDFSIAAQIRRHRVTHMQMTPSMAQMVAMNDAALGALAQVKHLFIGGEALPGALVRELKLATPASIENMYGPTETTIWSSTGVAEPCEGAVNIGHPVANTQLYVLDDAGEPQPVGMKGELYIGGDGVTRGYFGREAMTAERFIADPFNGGRMYRTGDLVRQRADGRIDFVGRADAQVKLRGYRIELGEIEARIAAMCGPGTQVVVTARVDNPGDMRLVAYLAGAGNVSERIDEKVLRAGLARDLPDYMIPAHIITLDAMPLTPNKKVDRAALPAPSDMARPDNVVGAFSRPKGQVERQIAEIWSRILGVAHISSNDNFFELGGHSLLAVQAHREIKAVLNITSLSITDIFRHPTLSGLAGMIEGDGGTPDDNSEDRQEARSDAMSRRRAMRAGRRR